MIKQRFEPLIRKLLTQPIVYKSRKLKSTYCENMKIFGNHLTSQYLPVLLNRKQVLV